MRFLFLLSGLLFFSSQFWAQSLLWEITGNNLKKPSYLYGTIHIQDKKVFAFDKIVEQKINECDAYAMEVLLDEIDQEAVKKSMLMKDKTLDQLLSKEDYELLNKLFKEKTGTGLLLFNKMKPFFVSSQLMQAGMSKDMPMALDMYFLDIARKAGKTALGIEKFEDQIAAIDQISLEDQAKMMLEGLKDTSSSMSDAKFGELLDTYLKADLDKMLELSRDTALPKNFNDAFLINRNVKMAANIAKFSKKQATFSAIGAAHLGGEKGVIALLRKKGYTVKPITFIFDTSKF